MSKMKLKDIKAELKKLGVEFDAKANYDTLAKLLADNIDAEEVEEPTEDTDEETSEEGEDTPEADEDEEEKEEEDTDEEDPEEEKDPKDLEEVLEAKKQAKLKAVKEAGKKAKKIAKGRAKAIAEETKAKEKGDTIKVVVESSFYDANDRIFRHGKTYDVTKSFFEKYEDNFRNENKDKVNLSDEPL